MTRARLASLAALCALAAACPDGPARPQAEGAAGPASEREGGPGGPGLPSGREGPAPERDRAPFVGVIKPRQAARIAPAEQGELAEVHVRAGDRVSRGDKIATLADRPIREALRGARAELRSAQGRLRRAQINRTEARRKLDTERELVAAGTSARRAVDDAEVALARAEADVNEARLIIEEIRVRVDSAERRLDETELTAPFSGTISVRFREPGSIVGPDAPVARLIATDALRVVFAVPAERIREVEIGESVSVTIDNVDRSLVATVSQVPPELDSASNMFFVEAELEVPEGLAGTIQPRLAARVSPERGSAP